MRNLVLGFIVAVVALAPAIAAAGTAGSGSGGTKPGSTGGSMPSGTSGGGSGSTSGSGSSATPSTSGSSSTSPAASPSGAGDFSKYTTQADCEKAGGMWQASAKKCAKK